MYGSGPNGIAGGRPAFNKFRPNSYGGPNELGAMIPKKDFGGPKLFGTGVPGMMGNGKPLYDKPLDAFGGPKKYNTMPNSYISRNSYGPKPDFNNMSKEERRSPFRMVLDPSK